jgi:WD40 repeat protein
VLHCRDTQNRQNLFTRKWDIRHIPQETIITRDERFLVHLFASGRMEVADLTTGEEISTRSNVWSVAAARGDALVASSSTVRLLSATQSAGARVLGSGYKMARDGHGFIRIFRDNPSRIEKISDPDLTLRATFPLPPPPISMTYNGKWVAYHDAVGSDGWIAPIDGKGKPVKVSPMPSNFAGGASGEVLAVWNSLHQTIRGLAGTTGKPLWEATLREGLSGMWINPSSSLLLVSTNETVLIIFDAKTGKRLKQSEPHNVRLTNVTFPSDDRFFTCGADGRAILWDTRTLDRVMEFRGNAVQKISGADLSPDRTRAATCSFSGAWQLWDVATGAQLVDIPASSLALRGILFTSDGRKLLTTGEDNVLRVWTTLDKDPTARIPVESELLRAIKN